MDKHENTRFLPQRYLFIPPPPSGYVEELMKACNVSSPNTVRFAVRGETFTQKAEEIRREYYKRYIKPYLKQDEI